MLVPADADAVWQAVRQTAIETEVAMDPAESLLGVDVSPGREHELDDGRREARLITDYQFPLFYESWTQTEVRVRPVDEDSAVLWVESLHHSTWDGLAPLSPRSRKPAAEQAILMSVLRNVEAAREAELLAEEAGAGASNADGDGSSERGD
ncbi:MAG: hypothetical protein AAGA57_06495 [Planctomycetota bacterium]